MVVNLLYYFFCLLVAGAALGIFFTSSPFCAALYLICIILGLAALYCLQGAPLIGIMQIILHVGGVLVLLLYLLFLKPETVVPEKKKVGYSKIICLGILLVFLILFGWQLSATLPALKSSHSKVVMPSATELSYQLVGPYGLVFELVGILLLVTLVSVLYMVSRDNR